MKIETFESEKMFLLQQIVSKNDAKITRLSLFLLGTLVKVKRQSGCVCVRECERVRECARECERERERERDGQEQQIIILVTLSNSKTCSELKNEIIEIMKIALKRLF